MRGADALPLRALAVVLQLCVLTPPLRNASQVDLAKLLAALPTAELAAAVAGQRVLELGCGHGLPGLAVRPVMRCCCFPSPLLVLLELPRVLTLRRSCCAGGRAGGGVRRLRGLQRGGAAAADAAERAG